MTPSRLLRVTVQHRRYLLGYSAKSEIFQFSQHAACVPLQCIRMLSMQHVYRYNASGCSACSMCTVTMHQDAQHLEHRPRKFRFPECACIGEPGTWPCWVSEGGFRRVRALVNPGPGHAGSVKGGSGVCVHW